MPKAKNFQRRSWRMLGIANKMTISQLVSSYSFNLRFDLFEIFSNNFRMIWDFLFFSDFCFPSLWIKWSSKKHYFFEYSFLAFSGTIWSSIWKENRNIIVLSSLDKFAVMATFYTTVASILFYKTLHYTEKWVCIVLF